ncbi:MAG: OmpA family protein, partial [Bacteroidetes bacterium]|nr:OmpA family protein [Bacteroidota bacterium]
MSSNRMRLIRFFSMNLLCTFVACTEVSAQYTKRSTTDYGEENKQSVIHRKQVRKLIETGEIKDSTTTETENSEAGSQSETTPPDSSGTQVQSKDAGDDFRFNPIYYSFDSYLLSFEGKKEMNRVSNSMSTNKIEVEIGGHTDHVGTRAYNKFLSQKRADYAKTFLMDKGIEKERIETKGYGEDFPAASNSTR